MRIPRAISVAAICIAVLVAAAVGLYVRHQSIRAGLLKPNVFPTNYHRWLFDRGYRYDFDEHESQVIGNWISTHQAGWAFSSSGFDPYKTQISGDNYAIEINSNMILLQYYKSEAVLAKDPFDGFVIIQRLLSPDEQSFWKEQVSEIRKSNQGASELPKIPNTH